ncbi:MAG: hypothetical protein GXO20_08010 [Thermodesulfobacteria bacterium]|nr:hypothetical protein [Thermodesulfobacteriota bacterium]
MLKRWLGWVVCIALVFLALEGTPRAQGTCNPFYLQGCLDQASCEAAGGQWYENQCVSQIPTKKSYVVVTTARHFSPGDNVLATAEEMKSAEPGPAEIGCVLLVPAEDQGKPAQLLMFAHHRDWGWVDLSPLLKTRQTQLQTSVKVTIDVDTTPFAGKKFTICGGYLTQDGTIGYGCYHLEIQEMERQKAVVLGQAQHFQGEDVLRLVRLEETAQAGPATIGCNLLVPAEDQGKPAQLLMFAHHKDWGWVDLSLLLKTRLVVLRDVVTVAADVDLTPLAGEEFVVCGGYFTNDQKLGYLCYRLKVE